VKNTNLDLIEEFSSLSTRDKKEPIDITSKSGKTNQTTQEHSHVQQQMPNTSHPQQERKKSSRLIETIEGQSPHKSKTPKVLLHQTAMTETTSIQQALDGHNAHLWQQAIQVELDSLKQNHTWILSPLPKDRKIVKRKWIFKIKHKVDGNILKYKAKLVTKGFTQLLSIDYGEAFFTCNQNKFYLNSFSFSNLLRL
jgi:hypothetical protein